MTIAESACGSSPSALRRLNISRQEMPASTRIRVQALATTAQFPRLPLASTVTLTLITAAYASTLWNREYFSGYPVPKGGPQTSDLGPQTSDRSLSLWLGVDRLRSEVRSLRSDA